MHSTTQKALRQFRGDNIYKQPYASLRSEDVNEVVKRVLADMGVEISTTEEYNQLKALSDACLNKVFSQYPGISDSDMLYAFKKEFEAQIKDVTNPSGGTERFTNTLTPGMHEAKIVAEPGSSEYAAAGSTVPEDEGWYDSRGVFHSNKYSRQPEASVGRDERHPNGPDTGLVPSYQATTPGDVHPSYSGVGSKPAVPELKRPEGKVGKMLLPESPLSLYKTRIDAEEVTYDGKRVSRVKIIAPTKPVVGIDVLKQLPAQRGIPSQAAAPVGYVQDDALFEQAATLDTAAMREDEVAREAELVGDWEQRRQHMESAKALREQAFTLRKSVTTGSLIRWLKLLEKKS